MLKQAGKNNIKRGLLLIFLISFSLHTAFAGLTDTPNDSVTEAEQLFKQAVEERNNKNFIKSRDLALAAITLNKTWGDPYLLIGVLYAGSYEICKEEALPGAIYCLAVDYFEKARQIDTLCAEKADLMINRYKNYFPSREETCGPKTGSKYLIGCWINEYTTLRYMEDIRIYKVFDL